MTIFEAMKIVPARQVIETLGLTLTRRAVRGGLSGHSAAKTEALAAEVARCGSEKRESLITLALRLQTIASVRHSCKRMINAVSLATKTQGPAAFELYDDMRVKYLQLFQNAGVLDAETLKLHRQYVAEHKKLSAMRAKIPVPGTGEPVLQEMLG